MHFTKMGAPIFESDSDVGRKEMMRYLGILILLGAFGCASTPPQQQPTHPSQIGSDAIHAGRLGYPLGTYLTIEGVRMEEGKVGTRTLLVDTINGQKLTEPIGVWIDNVKDPGLPRGTRCVVRGYESGRMIGLPDAVAKAENLPVPQAKWQFRKYFIMTSVIEPKTLEKE